MLPSANDLSVYTLIRQRTEAAVVNPVMDRVRAEMLRRIGLEDVLKPRVLAKDVVAA